MPQLSWPTLIVGIILIALYIYMAVALVFIIAMAAIGIARWAAGKSSSAFEGKFSPANVQMIAALVFLSTFGAMGLAGYGVVKLVDVRAQAKEEDYQRHLRRCMREQPQWISGATARTNCEGLMKRGRYS